MSAESELNQACREWRRLAETEGEAIRARNWPLVADSQKALQQLQPLILRLVGEARQEWMRSGLDRAAKENALHEQIAELLEIETQNNALLNDLRRSAQDRLLQLAKAGRTLRQVRRLYAPSRPAAWTSFS